MGPWQDQITQKGNTMDFMSIDAIWAILAIILIDLVLAGDNALVIGMAANRLPPHLRKKAIFWGTFGAIAVRFVSVAIITYLMLIPGLRLVGGIALVWIGWKLAFQDDNHEIKAADTFGAAITTIVIADAVMGVDNALGIAAAANGNWTFIIMGLLISIPVVIFGSSMVTKILDRWPNAVFIGSFVLFAVAVQMVLKEILFIDALADVNPWILKISPWIFAVAVTAIQFKLSKKANKTEVVTI
jgi:YjbE family integral membrane protein